MWIFLLKQPSAQTSLSSSSYMYISFSYIWICSDKYIYILKRCLGYILHSLLCKEDRDCEYILYYYLSTNDISNQMDFRLLNRDPCFAILTEQGDLICLFFDSGTLIILPKYGFTLFCFLVPLLV